MKSISNSDYSLIVEKLPVILRHAKENITASDLYACNALRRLSMLHKKLTRKSLKSDTNDTK